MKNENITSAEWLKQNKNDFDNRPEIIRACSEDLNISLRNARRAIKLLEDNEGFTLGESVPDTPEVVIDSNKLAHIDLVSKIPQSVEDLMVIAKLDKEEWDISKQVSNWWGSERDPHYQIKATFIRKLNPEVQTTIEYINKNLTISAIQPVIKYKPNQTKGLMAEIMLPDLHLGRVNAEGTATLKLVKEEFENAIDYFVDNVLSKFDIKKVVLVGGNDFYNSTNHKGETEKGTILSEHPLWEETFTMGVQLILETIIKIQNISGAEVEVINCVGNHDFQSSYYLFQIIETYFRENSMITVQGNLDIFKFTKFGKNLIGFTHRVPSAKTVSLPLLMADRKPKEWFESKVREWHVAHIHHKTTKTEHIDVNGVRIKSFPTITAHSDWENSKGYYSKREGTLLLWDSERGCIAEFYYKNKF